jgi:hypothetical protein
MNRLLVDSVSAVRAYLLSNVCVRLLRDAVARPQTDEVNVDHESVTLNWIAYCMVQGSTDIDIQVRKGSLEICLKLIEYGALHLESDNIESNLGLYLINFFMYLK